MEPCNIGNMELKNRIVMLATSTNYDDEMGNVTDRLIGFLEERAKGGVGLIIVESAPVDRAGSSRYTSAMMDKDERIPKLKKLTKSIHDHGAKVAIQLSHAGRFASIRATHLLGQSASGLAGATLWDSAGGQDEVRQIKTEEIQRIAEKFGEGARRAKEAGFDAVEIHGAHGLLIHEFLSPFVNKRIDGYGRDLKGRLRFPAEVLRAIRRKVDEDFPVIYRISAEEGLEGGLKIKESKVICQVFEKEGASAIDVSSGTAVTDPLPKFPPFPPMAFRRGIFLRAAKEIKDAVNIPVIAAGRINDPVFAEKILLKGKADLIGMCRGLIADAQLPNKVSRGILDDYRPCIACGTCLQTLFQRRPVECLVNPMAGREREFAFEKAEAPKRVCVVGGGPAGMEAARVASLRGHKVVLYEKEARLGGQLNIAVIPPHRGDIKILIKYLSGQMERLGVDVHLGREATAVTVAEENPDEVIVATGAVAVLPEIPGAVSKRVHNAWTILSGGFKDLGKKVLVVGGGRVSCETAEFLASKAFDVKIVTETDQVGASIEQNEKRYLLHRLEKYGVKILTNAKVLELTEGEVFLGRYGERFSVEADSVVLGEVARPNRTLMRALKDTFPNFYVIGDVLDPRSAKEAIYEGARIGRLI